MATQNYFKAKNGLEIPSLDTVATTSNSFPTIRPTLNLDFANSKTVDERITFTRSTKASYYDAKGVLQYAVADEPRIDHDPVTGECKGLLIEEQRTNATVYSDITTNYTANNCSIYPNITTAPDGSMSAAKMSENLTGSVEHVVLPWNSASAFPTGYVTGSIYVKAAGRTSGQFRLWGGGPYAIADFDLSAVTISSAVGVNQATNGSATITPVGNGWFRLAITANMTAVGISTMWLATSNGSNTYYVGDGSSGFYFWGAQLETGQFATSYIPSTTTFTSRASSASYFDSTGVLRYAGRDQARYGYAYDTASGKWASHGLMLESAATNRHISSNANMGSYLKTAPTTKYAASPDGTLSSTRYVDTGQSGYFYYSGGYSAAGLPSGSGAVTVSFFAKVSANAAGGFGIGWAGNTITVSGAGTSLTAVKGTNTTTPIIQYLANGWARISYTDTAPPWGVSLEFQLTTASGADIQLWGFQWETGFVATSYIPTYGVTATRAGDGGVSIATTRATDTADFNAINNPALLQSALTVYVKSSMANAITADGLRYPINFEGDNGSIDTIVLYNGSNSYTGRIWSNGASGNANPIQANATLTMTPEIPVSFAIAEAPGNQSYVVNGSVIATNNVTASYPNRLTKMRIGGWVGGGARLNGHVRKIALYNRGLSTTELQALTK